MGNSSEGGEKKCVQLVGWHERNIERRGEK